MKSVYQQVEKAQRRSSNRPFSESDFEEIQAIAVDFSDWKGSLEDATVVFVAARYSCPVWTYNFRDFSAFPALEL